MPTRAGSGGFASTLLGDTKQVGDGDRVNFAVVDELDRCLVLVAR
eukprot:COSAG05_NODE_532_length_8897_cov_18.622301_10_plen_45_part_00